MLAAKKKRTPDAGPIRLRETYGDLGCWYTSKFTSDPHVPFPGQAALYGQSTAADGVGGMKRLVSFLVGH